LLSSEISNELKSTNKDNSLINRQVKLTLPYLDHMTVEDLILKAGGLRESAATGFVEIVRRKKNIGFNDPSLINSQIAEIIRFGISNNLQLDPTASKFELAPFDEVFVRTSPNYELQQFITIQGQVVFPGVYGLERKDERISDIIKRVGGLNNQAFPEGAKLIRKNYSTEMENSLKRNSINDSQFKLLNQGENDISNEYNKPSENIGIDLIAALKNPGSSDDLYLIADDILDIPKEPQTVKVTGDVLYPNSVKYTMNNNLKDYINSSGGYKKTAAKNSAYVIYLNGSVKRVRSFGFIKFYPKIQKGSEIIVPKSLKSINTSQQIANIVGFVSTTITSLIGIVLLINSTTK
jgi:protein involved in polysaccharide export with SLBB domain